MASYISCILALSIFIAESNTAIKDISPKIANDNKLESPQLEQNSTLETPEKPIENKIEKPENIQINNLVQIQNKNISSYYLFFYYFLFTLTSLSPKESSISADF